MSKSDTVGGKVIFRRNPHFQNSPVKSGMRPIEKQFSSLKFSQIYEQFSKQREEDSSTELIAFYQCTFTGESIQRVGFIDALLRQKISKDNKFNF